MEFKEIDHLFDVVLERIENKSPLQKGAYETLPLGQDHFLLNKSWAYFKERVKAIEEQYEEQLKAKKQEITALEKEIQLHKEAFEEIERKNSFLNAFQETFVKSRSLDFMDFQKSQERLKNVWEEERQKLENKILALEQEVLRQKENSENMNQTNRERERNLQKSIDELKNKLILRAQEENEKVKEFMSELLEKEQVIQNREGKIDLLKEEVGRTNGIVKKLKEEITLWERRVDSLINKVEMLNRNVDGREQTIEQLKFKIETLQKEKDELKRNWEKEEASWRELWDRARTIQENEKARRKI